MARPKNLEKPINFGNQIEELQFEVTRYKNFWLQSLDSSEKTYNELNKLLNLIHSARKEQNTTIKRGRILEMESYIKHLMKKYGIN